MLEVNAIDIFYGASQALKKVSLKAEIGKVTCVLGRNGVGKTTLMKSITGHLQPNQGAITWQGKTLNGVAAADRAHKGIASVPQGREIFPQLTIMENLQTGFACLPRKERRIPNEIFDLFPVLKTMIRRRGGDLSGGQQQHLSLADPYCASLGIAHRLKGDEARWNPEPCRSGVRPASTSGRMGICSMSRIFTCC
jgi:urea transport system ATP-binding protein